MGAVKDEACAYLQQHLSPASAVPTHLLAVRHSCASLSTPAAVFASANLQRVAEECPLAALQELGWDKLLDWIAAVPLGC